ncbi:MAG: hypothetical protein AAB152_19095 [Candidatus Coatesbacteria bacterium]
MIQRLSLVFALLLGLFLVVMGFRGYPLPNWAWKPYYPSSAFEDGAGDPAMLRLVHDAHMSVPHRPSLAKPHELAKYGKAVLPYLVRLAGERRFYVIYFRPQHTWFSTEAFQVIHPHWPAAVEAIKEIRDPSAIPDLLLMARDP